MSEFNLSNEEIMCGGSPGYNAEKVKEFIRRETELIKLFDIRKIDFFEFMRRRKKLVGEKLV